MLEESRKKGASIFVYLIFCLLIAIFVINFGPQGGGGGGREGGCMGSSNTVVGVDGEDVSQTAWHIAFSNRYNQGVQKQKTYVALETLIRREILAQEAIARGLRVTDGMIDDQIKKGRFFIGGQRATIPGAIEEVDGETFYNHKAVKAWAVQELNVSLSSYRDEQKRGLLASMMAEILSDSVQVSRDEALQHYLFENNTVQYDVVAFRPDAYAAAMKLTDADVDRFLSTHGAEVEARYKADERTYKGVKPQLQLRQIFIPKLEEPKPETPPAPAPDQGSAAAPAGGSAAEPKKDEKAASPKKDEKAATAKKDEKTEEKKAEKRVGMPIDEAKAKLEAVRADVAAGKQKFADAAKQLNTDEAMKATGGDLGWRTADSAMLGDKAVTDAVKTLKPGEMTPVITTDRGAYLVMAESKREGDLTYDQVKHEIAKDLAREVWSKEAAKRAAISALDKARSGMGLNLDQMYEKEQAPEGPGIDIQQILNDPNLSDEDKKRLLQMMMQGQQKSGQIVWESKDTPAAWYAQADGAGSSKTATPAAGSAAPAAPAAAKAEGSAAPAAGSAAPAAGSAATAPAAPTTPAAPATEAVKPSSDQLPEFGPVGKPTVARFGPTPRSSTMSGIGASKAAQQALFEELSPGMLAKQVYEGDGAFLVVQLVSKTQPEVATFDKDADRLVAELRQSRAQAFLQDWMKERCEKLAKEGKIRPNPSLLRETDDQGKPLPVQYRPCMSFR